MKRITILLSLVIVLTVPLLGVADDDITPAKKVRILVNSNTRDPSAHNLTQGYANMAKIARANGYYITERSLFRITDKALAGFDIFFSPLPAISLNDVDKAALRKFMKNGGGVIFLAWAPPWAELSNLEGFLSEYGIKFGTSNASGPVIAVVPANSPLSGPLKCKQVYSGGGRAFLLVDTAKATVAALTDKKKEILAAVSKSKNLGKGQLVVVGDDLMFAYGDIGQRDNENFFLNILDFLQGGYDLSVLTSKAKGRNLYPGDKVTLISKVKNIGTSPSDPTIVMFVFVSAGGGGSAAKAEITLKEVKLKPLNPGKAKTVRTKMKIPDTVNPGAYLMLTVVDPKGESRDSNPNNNSKASKKTVTVN